MAEIKPIVFKIANQSYGVNIDAVHGIEKIQELIETPKTGKFFKGLINLRGDILPVYSLHRKFGLPDSTSEELQYLVIKPYGTLVAIEVDSVEEIKAYDTANLYDAPALIVNKDSAFYDKVLKTDDGLIMMIDSEKLLSEEELEMIAAMKSSIE